MKQASHEEQRGFLDFYAKHDVIPVSQDLGLERKSHWQRREALYRSLGLPPLAFRDKRVLEIGPGMGLNALVVDSWKPSYLGLLDANPASLRACRALVNKGDLRPNICEVIQADINTVAGPMGGGEFSEFDIVIAEAMIPGQVEPQATFQNVARHVGQNGALVVTTADSVSCLAELCRKLWLPAIRRVEPEFRSQVKLAASIFSSHLAALPGSSRPIDDWVIDNILHVWPTTWSFGMRDALVSAASSLEFLGSSPRFVRDFRWYKDCVGDNFEFNSVAMREWELVRLTTIDYRIVNSLVLEVDTSNSVARMCIEFDFLVSEILTQDDYRNLPRALGLLSEVGDLLRNYENFNLTAQAIEDFTRLFHRVAEGELHAEMGSFDRWWGRGQQYVSFTKATQ